ncbi:hypothetical protein OG271_19135 [Micromonospora rifamycinica]|uniref:hypothetical protein n=1 Tax=Micromonospora rifamycinica TaxID=291594 RepID=UPI002E2A9BD0|nr:hypothetical protein [Micromonospora rifamycinica]
MSFVEFLDEMLHFDPLPAHRGWQSGLSTSNGGWQMARWKWFQRKDHPVDVVGRSSVPQKADTAGPPGGNCATARPAWNSPTVIFARDLPLLTPAAQWRARNAVRGHRR